MEQAADAEQTTDVERVTDVEQAADMEQAADVMQIFQEIQQDISNRRPEGLGRGCYRQWRTTSSRQHRRQQQRAENSR